MLPSFENENLRFIGLDLVRTIAIIFVLISHCSSYLSAWMGEGIFIYAAVLGFYGVELFFVLSGFLIGRILLEIVQEEPNIQQWSIFLVRRWMRTLPAYYFWLFVFILGWYYPMFGQQAMHTVKGILPYYLTFTQNLAWPMVGNYFQITWSLAVEEWFYLLFSFVLIFGSKYYGRSLGIAISLFIFLIIPILLRLHLPLQVDWEAVTSKVVIYRLDAIATGVGAAWLYRHVPWFKKHTKLCSRIGLIIFLYLWLGCNYVSYSSEISLQLYHVFSFSITGISFLLCFPRVMCIIYIPKFFQKIIRYISNQSYSLYLIHAIVLEIVDYFKKINHWSVGISIVIALGSMGVLSAFSWYGLEKPLLSLRPYQRIKKR